MIEPTISSRFQIEAMIGEGKTGQVYRARDLRLGRSVAVKVLHSELRHDSELAEQFIREASVVAQLSSNPHIITIYDLGYTDQQLPYLVTELLVGRSLAEELPSSGRLARTWVVDVALQILSALMDSHAKGVVHRDIKPANIFVMKTATIPLLVKVLDFGLSAVSAGNDGLTHQQPKINGTPKYLAPEVWNGQTATSYADIYALGLILFEMATGSFPFPVSTIAECLAAHVGTPVPKFPEVAAVYPGAFEDLVQAMLAKASRERPDAAECFQRLSRISTAMDSEKLRHAENRSVK